MGVYIKGMEMPQNYKYVDVRIFRDGTATTASAEKPYYKKMDVVEVHTPHGRLIDADALMLMIQEYIDEYGWDVDEHGFHSEKWCAMKETEMAINDAPTVIEAEV